MAGCCCNRSVEASSRVEFFLLPFFFVESSVLSPPFSAKAASKLPRCSCNRFVEVSSRVEFFLLPFFFVEPSVVSPPFSAKAASKLPTFSCNSECRAGYCNRSVEESSRVAFLSFLPFFFVESSVLSPLAAKAASKLPMCSCNRFVEVSERVAFLSFLLPFFFVASSVLSPFTATASSRLPSFSCTSEDLSSDSRAGCCSRLVEDSSRVAFLSLLPFFFVEPSVVSPPFSAKAASKLPRCSCKRFVEVSSRVEFFLLPFFFVESSVLSPPFSATASSKLPRCSCTSEDFNSDSRFCW